MYLSSIDCRSDCLLIVLDVGFDNLPYCQTNIRLKLNYQINNPMAFLH